MNRLQKKCLIASAGMHCLLLLILLISPAFLTSKRDDVVELPLLNVIPAKITDDPFSSGGAPAEVAPPPPADPVLPRREPTPPPVQPRSIPEPVKPKPEPIKPPPPKREVTRPVPAKPEIKTEKPTPEKRERPKIQISREKVTTSRDTSQSRAAEAREAEERRRLLANLSRNLSSATSVSVPGPGQEAYANYAQVVKSKYYQAWVAPPEMAGNSAIVHTRVEIARDGTVISARITKGTGDRAMDESVERALKLKYIAPFPEGATDLKRVFEIGFTLKSR